MSYSRMLLDIMKEIPQDNKLSKKALGIGTHNFTITKRQLSAANIKLQGLDTHEGYSGTSYFSRSSKWMTRQLFNHFHYTYNDLDIDPAADWLIDLNDPLPQSLANAYDLVIDITSNYVTDIKQAFNNTSKMTKVRGYKVVSTHLGDHTNRFELNPSPNFLIDFHVNNGFQPIKMFLLNRRGKSLPYIRKKTKSTPVAVLLPLYDFIVYSIKRTIMEVFLLRSSHKITNNLTGRLQLFYENMWSFLLPDWVFICILQKVEDKEENGSHITEHYRHFKE